MTVTLYFAENKQTFWLGTVCVYRYADTTLVVYLNKFSHLILSKSNGLAKITRKVAITYRSSYVAQRMRDANILPEIRSKAVQRKTTFVLQITTSCKPV